MDHVTAVGCNKTVTERCARIAVFELIRRHGTMANAEHCAFDLLQLDGRNCSQNY
jgi:hypothetical protein